MQNSTIHKADQDALLSLIDIIGQEDFVKKLADFFEHQYDISDFHIFSYRKDVSPSALASRPFPVAYQQGLENFLKFTYVVNPAYRAFQKGVANGVYQISELMGHDLAEPTSVKEIAVHLDVNEPIGYRTPHWPREMDEVIILVNLPDESALEFTFLIPSGSDLTYSRHNLLSQIFPYLEKAIERQFALKPDTLEIAPSTPNHEIKFQNFGEGNLTDREKQVTRLILIGHSSASIAMQLGIAMPTVKTHRRSIFSKLEISSQAELFHCFLEHLRA